MLEFYVLARRRGDIREVLYDWMDQIRQLLSSHLLHARDPEIDDLLTSLILHCPSGLERSDPDWIRRAVRGLISVRR